MLEKRRLKILLRAFVRDCACNQGDRRDSNPEISTTETRVSDSNTECLPRAGSIIQAVGDKTRHGSRADKQRHAAPLHLTIRDKCLLSSKIAAQPGLAHVTATINVGQLSRVHGSRVSQGTVLFASELSQLEKGNEWLPHEAIGIP